jgi:ankyrin repeat protein
MTARKSLIAFSGALVLAGASAGLAQGVRYSDSFTFLKAVRARDGAKAAGLAEGARGSAVINAKDPETGDTGIHIVTRERDLSWIAFLLSKGARTDVQNKEGATPLVLAAQIGWTPGADILLRAGASVDYPNGRGETPLIFAVRNRDLEMVRLLLSRNANPERTDSVAGYSALDYARQDRRASAVLKLLEAQPKRKEAAGPVL